MNRICLILLLNLITYACFSQQMVNDVIGTSGDEISNADLNINHTTSELITTTINNTSITLTQGFHQTSQIVYIQPKAFLQGALLSTSDGLMRDDLRIGNYIPEESPYNANVKVSNNAFATTGNDAIVDWVTVEIRNSNFRVVGLKSALVQRDGDIVSADGTSPIQFTSQNNDYYVEINHRNHLGTMTRDQVTLSNTPTPLNFTDGSLPLYGNFSQVEINPTTYALWGGNANADDRTRYQGSNNDTNFIKDQVRFHPNNPSNSNFFVYFDYSNADINMDGRVRYQGSNNDTNIIKDIVRLHPNNPALSNFFLILQQTPF